MPEPVITDDLWKRLTDEAITEAGGHEYIIMRDFMFRVAIVNAYKKGWQDGFNREPEQGWPT